MDVEPTRLLSDGDSGNESGSGSHSPPTSKNCQSFLISHILSRPWPPPPPSFLVPVPLIMPSWSLPSFHSSAFHSLPRINEPPALQKCLQDVLMDGTSSPSSSASHASSSPSSSSIGLPPNSRENCIVCDDKASGFHYGIMSCEGCKGFFRRTVQKNIDYNCHKNNDCPVNRITRNRCQSCRFNKCLRAGMTRESVRQDRNRKRKSKDDQLERELQDTARVQNLIKIIVAAHNETSSSPKSPLLINLNDDLSKVGLDRIAQFAHKVPGFDTLARMDQRMLIERTSVSIVLLRSAFLYDQTDLPSSLRENGTLIHGMTTFEIVNIVRKLRSSLCHDGVFNEEIALLSAICLLRADCPELIDPSSVERILDGVLEALQMQIQLREASPVLFARMLMKLSELLAVTMRHSCNSMKKTEAFVH